MAPLAEKAIEQALAALPAWRSESPHGRRLCLDNAHASAHWTRGTDRGATSRSTCNCRSAAPPQPCPMPVRCAVTRSGRALAGTGLPVWRLRAPCGQCVQCASRPAPRTHVLPREESLDALLDRMGVRVGIQHPAKRLNRGNHADLGPGPLAGSRGHQLAQRLVGGSRQTPQQLASSGGTLPSGECGLELLMDGNKAKETLGGLGCELIGRQVRVIYGQIGGVGHGTRRALPVKALCPSSRTPCAAAH
jgi:hypothetical protein